MPDNRFKTVDVPLRQRIQNIIETQYEIEDNGQTTQELIDSTISILGDRPEAGEIFIDQALGFAIEKLVTESGAPQPIQDAIHYGGGLK